jgi:hypothetical protein
MGVLKDLKDINKRVHLLLTSSDLAEMYVYDALKERCQATLESVLEVNNAGTFKSMCELVNVQPNLADNWLFVVKYSKVKSQLKKVLGIFESMTSVFLIKVDNYKDFKEFKELYSQCNDLYLQTIRRADIYYLLNGYSLSPKVLDFIATSYFKEPEKVFELVRELSNGAVIENTKDVIKLCGESMGSIQKFVMQLLTDAPKTEMFLKRSYKKRVGVLYDLCESFNPKTAYNYIRATIKDVLYIKMLYLEGSIYDKVRDLPECFDEKKLSRYNYVLKTITCDISYSRILNLYNKLYKDGRWYSTQDGISFLYRYYLDLLNNSEVA